MEFSLKGALKKHRRMRSWREVVVLAALPISFGVSWFFDFGRTDTLIAAAIACVFAGFGQLEIRLKTVQVRLAGVDDKLHNSLATSTIGRTEILFSN
ncbi:MAG TPA: hypothetical protein VL198_16990 [Pseudolabrys sp.]|jgi:Na+-translocating ferredoxin:NAD+ oxidoreductase RnfD subunit|nr:hypothetical protein [Pseudolabrys sp.]